jgi:hypothetical protein
MSKVAIAVCADFETPEALGRVRNSLETVKEFKVGRDYAQLIFDGVGPAASCRHKRDL